MNDTVRETCPRSPALERVWPSNSESEAADEPVGQASKQHCGKTILLVEDEDFVREITSQVLQAAGYVVLRARNANEAIAVFREHAEVHLLLTDIIMPGRSGTDLAEELKLICPKLRVIFMSGYPDVRSAEVDAGVYYLAKPFSVQILTLKIRRVLAEDVPARNAESLRLAAGSR